MSPRTIVFCGGGSVGHVAPSVAVARAAMALDPDMKPLFYCADRADEREFLAHEKLEFRTLPAAKFPRGFSADWLTFPLVFPWSVYRAWADLKKEMPAAVFSKGGYVGVPLCIAAKMLGIPVVLHESDATGGMGNALVTGMAKTVCLGFPADHMKPNAVATGNPVRPDVTRGSLDAARRITGFSGRRPVVLVIGGSQGSVAINEAVDRHFDELIDMADVVHVTGAGKAIARTHARYWAKPFVTEELPHLYALANVAVTRAGAGVLSELAALSMPAVVVPLRGVAQDHQQRNAERLAEAGAAVLLPQLNLGSLPSVLRQLIGDQARCAALGAKLHAFFPADAAEKIARALLDAAK